MPRSNRYLRSMGVKWVKEEGVNANIKKSMAFRAQGLEALTPKVLEMAALLYLEFRATLRPPPPQQLQLTPPDKMMVYFKQWVTFTAGGGWVRTGRTVDQKYRYGTRHSVKLTYTRTSGNQPLMYSIVSNAKKLKPLNFSPKTGEIIVEQKPFENWIDRAPPTKGVLLFGGVEEERRKWAFKNHRPKPTPGGPLRLPPIPPAAAAAPVNYSGLVMAMASMKTLWDRFQEWKISLAVAQGDLGATIYEPNPTLAPEEQRREAAKLRLTEMKALAYLNLSLAPHHHNNIKLELPYLLSLYNNINNAQCKAAAVMQLRQYGYDPEQTKPQGLATNICNGVRIIQEQWFTNNFLVKPAVSPPTTNGWAVQPYRKYYIDMAQKYKCGKTDAADAKIHRACSIVIEGEGGKYKLRPELEIGRLYGVEKASLKVVSWPSREVAALAPWGAGAGAITAEEAALARRRTRERVAAADEEAIPPPALSPSPNPPTAQGVWFMVSLPKMPHTLIVIIRMGVVFTIGGGYDPAKVTPYKPLGVDTGCVQAPLLIFSPDTAIFDILEPVGKNQFAGTLRGDGFYDQYITNAGIYDREMESRLRELIRDATNNYSKGHKDDIDTFHMPSDEDPWKNYSSWSGEWVGGMNCMSVASWIAGLARSWIMERPTAPAKVAAKAGPKIAAWAEIAQKSVYNLINQYFVPSAEISQKMAQVLLGVLPPPGGDGSEAAARLEAAEVSAHELIGEYGPPGISQSAAEDVKKAGITIATGLSCGCGNSNCGKSTACVRWRADQRDALHEHRLKRTTKKAIKARRTAQKKKKKEIEGTNVGKERTLDRRTEMQQRLKMLNRLLNRRAPAAAALLDGDGMNKLNSLWNVRGWWSTLAPAALAAIPFHHTITRDVKLNLLKEAAKGGGLNQQIKNYYEFYNKRRLAGPEEAFAAADAAATQAEKDVRAPGVLAAAAGWIFGQGGGKRKSRRRKRSRRKARRKRTRGRKRKKRRKRTKRRRYRKHRRTRR